MVVAKESHDISRLRNRLKKHLDAQDRIYSVAALIRMSELIKKHLIRDKKRQELTDKQVTLFDHNRHSAPEEKGTLRIKKLVAEEYFPRTGFVHHKNEQQDQT